MRFWKAALLALTLITSTTLVAASPAELSLFPQESSAEVNSFTSYELTVENTGTVKDVYELYSGNDRVTIKPNQIEVEPGQSETAHAWYNPDETQKAGRYAFTVNARSRATGEEYSIEGRVKVVTDHEIDVSVSPDNQIACRGQDAVYQVELTNEGIQREEFQVATELGQLSQDKVTLEEGETKTVELVVSSNEPMEQDFTVVADSPTSYAKDSTTVGFSAETCYDSEMSVEPDTQEIGAFLEGEYEVTVRNTGTREDTFTLSTDRGELEEEQITIEGNSAETVTLTYVPEELGTQKINVEAEGISSTSASATAEVYNPMDFELEFDRESRNVCENGQANYTVTVTNTGEVTERYRLETSLGSLSATEGKLQPGESGQVQVNVDAEDLEVGKYSVEVKGIANTFGEPQGTVNSELMVENCWDLDMDVVPNVMSAGENRSVIYEVHLDNTGTKENTYHVTYQGPEWISIRPSEVTVGSGEKETAYMYAGIPFGKDEGEVEINVTSEGTHVKKSETVKLVLGEEMKNAIRDDRNMLTGWFTRSASNISETIRGTTDIQRVIGSIVVGLLITLAVLYSEW